MRRKENFPLLDGLRGVAALAIFVHHGRGFMLGPDSTSSYLAVDFFFMLSGFVICAAYGRRLEAGLTWKRFMTIRMIRLWPMLIIGGLIGGVVRTLELKLQAGAHPWVGLVEGVGAALLVPAVLFTGREVFPADGPIWSLFFEIFVNALYGLRLRFSTAVWAVILLFFLVVLATMARTYGTFDNLGYHGVVNFLGGVPRVIVPFAIGVILYQKDIFRRCAKVPSWVPALGLAAALSWQAHPAWLFDLGAVVLVFPFLVAFGARSPLGPRVTQLTMLSGELSYPVYLLHQPIIRAFLVAEKMRGYTPPFCLNLSLAFVVTLTVSWLLLVWVDRPVRRALDQWLLKDKNQREVLLQPAL